MDDQIKILNSMGILVMEGLPDGGFRRIGNAPGWLGLFLMKDSELRPDKMSLFLENFLIDAVVYGKCDTASVVFDNGRIEAMQELGMKYGNFNNIKLFRCDIPVDETMIGVFGFQISLDGNMQESKGYLIGCTPGTDMNPLSVNYGNPKP